MFRLVRFKATNIIGFVSGLGRKSFTLDFSEFKNKTLMVIVGDNATGKSTFASLVHPTHTPSDDRSKFVVPGKEGSLIRVYEGDDGTIITTKCIYHPKSNPEDGHTPKCYLSIKRPDEKDDIEMNPNGNVTSYTSLLYTYFGITKEYINFASYSDAVDDIVTMTDTERKVSMSTIIPNTKRLELTYSIVNDKYKNLRNMVRNVSQKILALRDEESLNQDLKRVTKELNEALDDKDTYTRKFAKAEGRVKELSHGENINELISAYQSMVNSLISFDSKLMDIRMKLFTYYKKLGITPKPDSIEFDGMDKILVNIGKYERKIASSESTIRNASDQIDKLKSELFQIEKEITESESVLFSLQTQDVKELEKTRDEYLKQISELRYAKDRKKYDNMSYDEVVGFSRSVAILDRMISALYEDYGEMVSHYLNSQDENYQYNTMTTIDSLSGSIQTKSAKRDSVYRALIEKKQYQQFQDILDQRPKTCHDDTCPFIANALKWSHIAGEITELKEQYEQLNVEIAEDEKSIDHLEKELTMIQTFQNLKVYLDPLEELIKKYFHVDMKTVYDSIANCTWGSVLDILTLKSIAAILSEKDLYIRITTQILPEINHSIELAKLYGTNRNMIQTQLARLNRNHEDIKENLDNYTMKLKVSQGMKDAYDIKLHMWKSIYNLIEEYRSIAEKRIQTADKAEERKSEIGTIQDLVKKCSDYDERIREADHTIEELSPIRQQIQMDISTLIHLKDEKDQIEHDFIVVEVLKAITQPGKGVWKELIRMYMDEIYTTSNQLLLNTFGGKLYLKRFIITDKEFVIPFVYNGSEGSDIAYASSSQQSTIAMAISLAIMSTLIDKYGVLVIDEADRALSAENKAVFVDILAKQMNYIGVSQSFVITHSPEYYRDINNVCFIAFPGANIKKREVDYIEV